MAHRATHTVVDTRGRHHQRELKSARAHPHTSTLASRTRVNTPRTHAYTYVGVVRARESSRRARVVAHGVDIAVGIDGANRAR
jgi:hypothetical protein